MGKYYAVYKCLMCSKEFRISDTPTEMEENAIPGLLAKIVANQQFIGTQFYQAHLCLPHKCGNGDGGVANLIGFRKVK